MNTKFLLIKPPIKARNPVVEPSQGSADTEKQEIEIIVQYYEKK